MNNLIDHTIFVGDINIPNSTQIPVSEDLDDMIKSCQEEFLVCVLGLGLYEAFESGLNQAPVSQIWMDLRDGKMYDYYSNRYWYQGLKKAIAYYVYFRWSEKEASQTTGVGESITKTENADRYSPWYKMVDAWNSMVELNLKLRDYLNRNAFTYADYRSYNCNQKFYQKINSFGL